MEIIFYLSLLFLFFFSAIFLELMFKKTCNSNRNLPPSPPSLPLIGHLHLLSPVITKCLHKISSKHGPFLHLCLGSRPFLVVSSAEFAAEIYKKHDITFSIKPKAVFDDSLLFGSSSFITAPYGDYWRFMKKLCVTDLLGSKHMRRSRGVRREELMVFLEKLVEKAKKKESVEIGKELMKLTNNIICRMLMSTRCSKEDDEAEKCRKLVKGSLDLAGKMVIVTMLGPFKKLGILFNRKQSENIAREFHKLFDKIIEEHEESLGKKDESKDLMDILLKVYNDPNAEFKISKTQIKAVLLDLFIAGTDTSGNSMEWVMAELINHPNVMNKLRKEIESVVGTKRLVEEYDILNMHYLQAVVKETLRLHPVLATNFRECSEDCKIREYDIPKGMVVIINAYSIMRDPNVWNLPNEFFPERFLQGQDNPYRHDTNFITFGGGRRMCPGSELALCMISVTIACLVQCFDWKVEEKVCMDERVGMIVSKAYPLICFPVLRFNPFVV